MLQNHRIKQTLKHTRSRLGGGATKRRVGDKRRAHMSAHTPVSQAVGDGFHPAMDGGPPFAGCGW